jgi:hypothetical protein
VVRRRYPDLIAILPEVGVLVIEVKDWWLAELGSVNADTVTITRRGTATVVPHPRRQARGYMLRLLDECRRPATTRTGRLRRPDSFWTIEKRVRCPFHRAAATREIGGAATCGPCVPMMVLRQAA